jgi:hypothetical protein
MGIREKLAVENKDMLFADGFDNALIGTSVRDGNIVALYSTKKCIEVLSKEMSYEDAIDFFYVNVEGSYLGPNTPLFEDDLFEEE